MTASLTAPRRSPAPVPDESDRCSGCGHFPGCDCPHPCTPQSDTETLADPAERRPHRERRDEMTVTTISTAAGCPAWCTSEHKAPGQAHTSDLRLVALSLPPGLADYLADYPAATPDQLEVYAFMSSEGSVPAVSVGLAADDSVLPLLTPDEADALAGLLKAAARQARSLRSADGSAEGLSGGPDA